MRVAASSRHGVTGARGEPSRVQCPWTVKSPPGRRGVAGKVTQSQISRRVGWVRRVTIFIL